MVNEHSHRVAHQAPHRRPARATRPPGLEFSLQRDGEFWLLLKPPGDGAYRLKLPEVPSVGTFIAHIDTLEAYGDDAAPIHPLILKSPAAMNTRLPLPAVVLSMMLALPPWPVAAHRDASTDLSAASALPVAISVVAPAGLMASAGEFTAVAVQASTRGSTWVLERASDGARASVHFASDAAQGLVLSAGMTLIAVTSPAGWVLAQAGKAVAIIPNALGQGLLHHERISR